MRFFFVKESAKRPKKGFVNLIGDWVWKTLETLANFHIVHTHNLIEVCRGFDRYINI